MAAVNQEGPLLSIIFKHPFLGQVQGILPFQSHHSASAKHAAPKIPSISVKKDADLVGMGRGIQVRADINNSSLYLLSQGIDGNIHVHAFPKNPDILFRYSAVKVQGAVIHNG